MRVLKSRRAGLAISVAVVAAVAGITLGVTTLAGVTFQGHDTGPAEGTLATASRDGLAICVQAVGVDSSVEAGAKNVVESALPEAAKHADWEPAGLAAAEPTVDIGCPSQPPPFNPEWERSFALTYGHKVSEPSKYQLFVFILPEHTLEDTLNEFTPRQVSQEQMCEGDACWQVTAALYVSPEELANVGFLTSLLLEGVGLGEP